MRVRKYVTYIMLLLIVFMAGCPLKGDGDDESGAGPTSIPGGDTNTSPIANAGSNQSIRLGETINLNGSNSFDPDSDNLTYLWRFTLKPNGNTDALENNTKQSINFTPKTVGEYEIELIVNDGTVDSAPDLVSIKVSPVDGTNLPPSADAGKNRQVTSGDEVILDGSNSSDIDGIIVDHSWVSKDGNISLSSTTTSITKFIAPVMSISTDYKFELTVTDNDGASSTDTVMITVLPRNEAPIAKASIDKTTINVGEAIMLDASSSTDPNHDSLTYLWSILTSPGSAASLNNPNNVTTTFTPDVAGNYTFELAVSDGHLSDVVTVSLTVNEENTFTKPEMIKIPVGSFQMGDISGGGENNEKPVHSVTIEAFEMAKYEVTLGQFRAFVDDTGYQTDAEKGIGGIDGCFTSDSNNSDSFDWQADSTWQDTNFDQTENDPVVCVSKNDARAYIDWLNEQTGLNYRLPSEAEWEYAARAGTTEKYSFGNTDEDLCTYGNVSELVDCSDGYDFTAPVGQFEANPFGLHDIHGNVWEWTQDCWHDNYIGAPDNGRAWGSVNCDYAVSRGGSWANLPPLLRVSYRESNPPGVRNSFYGFRLARSLTTQATPQQTTTTLEVINNTSITIWYFYFKESSSSSWGGEYIGSGNWLYPGQTYTLYEIPCDKLYDMKVQGFLWIDIASQFDEYLSCGTTYEWLIE